MNQIQSNRAPLFYALGSDLKGDKFIYIYIYIFEFMIDFEKKWKQSEKIV
jgi:hypothetical protein